MTSDRSWWGWGSIDEALTEAEELALVGRVSAILPDHDFTDHPLLDPADLAVARPLSAAKAALDPAGIRNPGVLI